MADKKYMEMIMLAEIFKDGKWQQSGPIFKSAFSELSGKLVTRVCDEVNYVLYEIMSGVHQERNNCYTQINAINHTDGLPNDCSYHEIPGTIKHMTSYTTLKSVIEYNWNHPISKVGIISKWQYKRLKKDGIWPVNMNRTIFDADAKIVSPFEMDMILSGDNNDDRKYYVRMEYDATPIREKCKFFCEESIPTLMKLVPQGGTYDDVRLVCMFK